MSKQAGILIIGRFFAFIFNFILPVVLVRIFDKEQFGLYRQLILIHITFFPILQLGISQSLYYFYPREESKRALLIRQSFFFLMLIGLFFFIIMFFFKDIFASYFFHNDLMVKFLPLLGLFTGLMIPTSILEILLIVEKKVKLASLITFLSAAVRVLLVLLFAFILRSVYFLILALAIFSGIRLIFLTGYIFDRYKIGFKKVNLDYFKKVLLYAIPFGFAVIMVTLNTTIDKFAITYLFSPSHFAIYSIGCYQIPIITITFNAVLNIVLPKIALLQKEKKPSEILVLWHRAMRKLALIGFPVFIFFFAFAKEFITFIFTLKYADSTPVFRVSLFVILINVTIYGVIVRAYGKTSYIFLVSVISFLIALLFIYPACKYFGLSGAAIVIVFTHGVLATFQLIKTKSLLEIKFSSLLPWKTLLKILVIAVFSVTLLIPIKYLHFLNSFSILTISSLLFSLIYLLSIWHLPLLTLGEKKQFKRYLSRIYYSFGRGHSLKTFIIL